MARKWEPKLVNCHRCNAVRLGASQRERANRLGCALRAELPPIIGGEWDGRPTCGTCLRELAALAEYRRRRAVA